MEPATGPSIEYGCTRISQGAMRLKVLDGSRVERCFQRPGGGGTADAVPNTPLPTIKMEIEWSMAIRKRGWNRNTREGNIKVAFFS